MNNIKLGADPELFLEKNDDVISAEGLLGGTKMEPRKISNEGHAVQEDNIMVEFNIPAASTREAFVEAINYVKDYLEVFASVNGASLSTRASALVDKSYLRSTQARTFGCDPDFNVYTKQVNAGANPNTSLRTCGGHIHVGYDNPTQEESEAIILAMDMLLGLESLQLDTDDARRSMYGKAGSFRFKEYGVEYRTLSNFWIMNDDLIKWAFDKTQEAVELVRSGEIHNLHNELGDYVQKAINENDKELAGKLLKRVKQKQLTIA